MAKPIICDRCQEVKSEEDIIKESTTRVYPMDERFAVLARFIKISNAANADICRKCSRELLIQVGERVAKILREEKSKCEKTTTEEQG